jgi:SOS-response transcriptional repressor LexA
MKKRALTPEELRECNALKAIYRFSKSSHGLSQGDLAEELGVSQSAISMYMNGVNALNLPIALKFAKVLKVPLSDFSPRLAGELEGLTGADEYATDLTHVASADLANPEPSNVALRSQPVLSYRYPVISWVAAGAWAEAIEPFAPGAVDEYETSDYKAKGVAFWLQVKGDSMTAPTGPSISEGTLILIDTEADVAPGKLVVAKLIDGNEATFKKLVEDAGKRFLKPLNPSYPMIPIDSNCLIVGVAVRASLRL